MTIRRCQCIHAVQPFFLCYKNGTIRRFIHRSVFENSIKINCFEFVEMIRRGLKNKKFEKVKKALEFSYTRDAQKWQHRSKKEKIKWQFEMNKQNRKEILTSKFKSHIQNVLKYEFIFSFLSNWLTVLFYVNFAFSLSLTFFLLLSFQL